MNLSLKLLSSVLFFTLLGINSCSGQSNYQLSSDNQKITFTPYKETAYVTKRPEDRCFLIRYIDEAIYQLLQYINLQKDPPYGDEVYNLMRSVMAGNITMTDLWNSKEYQKTLFNSQVGFAICVTVGVALAILVPLVGLIIFACRCFCNNCRARYVLPKNSDETSTSCDNCSRKFLTLWLVIFIKLILSCGLILLWVNYDMGNSMVLWKDSFANGKQDLKTYGKNVQKGYEYAITTQIGTLKQVLVTKNLNSTQTTLGALIQQKIKDENPKFALANETWGALKWEVESLTDIYAGFQVQSYQAEHLKAQIAQELSDVIEDINKTATDCGQKCADVPVTRQNIFAPDDNFKADLNQMEDLLQLQADLRNALTSSQYQFDTILTDTEGQVLDQNREVSNLLDEAAKSTFSSCYDDIVSNVSRIHELIPDEVIEKQESSLSKDEYRGYAGYGVAALLIFIILLSSLSVCCGVCGYDEEATPAQRTSLSHCGGLTLVLTVVLCFFSFSVLMLISVSGLLSGGNMKLLVCQDMSYPFISKVIDVPGTLRGYDGNFMSSVLYNQPEDTEAKLSDMIKSCQEDDGSAIEGLKYDKVLSSPLRECLAYESSLSPNLKAQVAKINVDIKTDKLLPSADDTKELVDSYASLLSKIKSEAEDFLDILQNSGQIESYSLSTLSYNLKRFADDLETYEEPDDTLALLKAQLELQQSAEKMDAINVQYLEKLRHIRSNMITELQTFIAKINSIEAGEEIKALDGKKYNLARDFVENLVQEATKTLKSTSSKAPEETPQGMALTQYRGMLTGYIDEFGSYLDTEIVTRVGHCRPLFNVHRAIYEATCIHMLSNYNQYWFFLLICTLSIIPIIFVALKLSNHYRVLEPEDPETFDKRFEAEGVPLKAVDRTAIEYEEEYSLRNNNRNLVQHQSSLPSQPSQTPPAMGTAVTSFPNNRNSAPQHRSSRLSSESGNSHMNNQQYSTAPPMNNGSDAHQHSQGDNQPIYPSPAAVSPMAPPPSGYQPIRVAPDNSLKKHGTNYC